jgi:translation initiation factor IF-2
MLPAVLAPGTALAQADPAAAPAPVAAATTAPDGQDDGAPPPAPAPAPPSSGDGPAPLAESPLVGPKIDVSVPPPAPSVTRKMNHHDGFYLRASVGLGTRSSFVATDSTSHPNYTVNGGGISLDLLIGGTPSPGLALGGGLMLSGVTDGEVRIDGGGNVGSGTGGLILLGPFVDGFPMANRGLHLGGLVGLAGGGAKRQDNQDEFDGAGLGMAVWIGHGFWVGKEWSLGGDLKLDAAFLRDDSGEVVLADTWYGFSLLFTVLYH